MNSISQQGVFAARVDEIYTDLMVSGYKDTDRQFLKLLILEWIACILIAACTSPFTWNGSQAQIHIHLIAAIFLGGMFVAGPAYFIHARPGHALTRHVVAIGQMLFSSLLIHLTGGRIETHFHIFGSLAFLSFYRDWRVLITASLVVILDHVLRGIFMPESIYGVDLIEPWRWLEHAWWVIFEDTFLIVATKTFVTTAKDTATRQAEIELTRDKVEETVKIRTKELIQSERRLTAQYAVSKILAESETLGDAFPKILLAVNKNVFDETVCSRTICGEIWQMTPYETLACKTNIKIIDSRNIVQLLSKDQPSALITNVFENKRCAQSFADEAGSEGDATEGELAFPVVADGEIKAIVSFTSPTQSSLSADELSVFEALGRQIGQYMIRRNVESQNLQLASIVQSSSDAIISQDRSGKIISWNLGAERLFGYTASEAIGLSATMLLPTELRDAEIDQLDFVENMETVRVTKSGARIDVEIATSPIHNADDQIIGTSCILRDIAERKESAKRVSEFYSIVSHELRSPLTSIRGALGLIEGGVVECDSPEVLDLIVVARESSDRLIRLINDILDLKKIEAGKFELAKEDVYPLDLIKFAVDSLSGMAEEAKIALDQNIVTNVPIDGDRDRCTQVLVNLTSNAIKFSPPESHVKITAELTANSRIRFSVSDNGPGIPDEQLHKLFDKFQQLDSSDTRAKGGTGLGLAISKAIVEEHGGSIGVESTPNVGTTFWFELPIAASARKSIQHQQFVTSNTANVNVEGNNECHVLIVEDDELLAQVLAVHVGSEGFGVTKVKTLAEARAALAKKLPEVMILDLKLPDGDGLALLEELRDNPLTSNIPVVVVTGRESEEGYSCNPMIFDWIQKPFDTQTLITAIERSIALPNKRRVLIIGNDASIRHDITSNVFKMGLECIQAKTHEEAIRLSQEWSPNLVLIDFDMLTANLVTELRQTPTRKTPLIVFSSTHQNEQSLQDLSIGIARYLTNEQEFSLTDFEKVVQELMGEVRSKRFDMGKLETLMN